MSEAFPVQPPEVAEQATIDFEHIADTYGIGPEEAMQIVEYRGHRGTVAQMLDNKKCPMGGAIAGAYQEGVQQAELAGDPSLAREAVKAKVAEMSKFAPSLKFVFGEKTEAYYDGQITREQWLNPKPEAAVPREEAATKQADESLLSLVKAREEALLATLNVNIDEHNRLPTQPEITSSPVSLPPKVKPIKKVAASKAKTAAQTKPTPAPALKTKKAETPRPAIHTPKAKIKMPSIVTEAPIALRHYDDAAAEVSAPIPLIDVERTTPEQPAAPELPKFEAVITALQVQESEQETMLSPSLYEVAELLFAPPAEESNAEEQPSLPLSARVAEQFSALAPEEQEQAVETMTAIAAIVGELKSVNIAEITPEKMAELHAELEELCAELYETLGIEMSEQEIRQVVIDILLLACAPQRAGATTVEHVADNVGTHEHKRNLSLVMNEAAQIEHSLFRKLGALVIHQSWQTTAA